MLCNLKELISQKPLEPAYTIRLSGGSVLFLRFSDFLTRDGDFWIKVLGEGGCAPEITSPQPKKGFDLQAIDALCPKASWCTRLRIHHSLGKLNVQHDAPSYAYFCFHQSLALEEYNYPEFVSAWVMMALGDCRLTDSLAFTRHHIPFRREPEPFSPRYIFRRTPFVTTRLNALPQELRMKAEECWEEQRKAKPQLSRRPCADSYTITLGPGEVRYLPLENFFKAEITEWIEVLQSASGSLMIRNPEGLYRLTESASALNLTEVDRLFGYSDWKDRLRTHHAIGRFCTSHGIPSTVYCCFHSTLELDGLAIEECRDAWIKQAFHNADLAASYLGSHQHLVVPLNHGHKGLCIFRKTAFVEQRLCIVEKRAADQKRIHDETVTMQAAEELRKSGFSTYVYIIEDMRNGYFKIGQSIAPQRRERTLQSEVPELASRFRIPAEDHHEQEIHHRFAAKRVRGEYFKLSANDLLWIMSFLKENGDVSRRWVDPEWLANIFFTANEAPRNGPTDQEGPRKGLTK